MASRAQIAKPDIVKVLAGMPPVFRIRNLEEILAQHRDQWRLTKSTTLKNFTDFLIEKTQLESIKIPFPRRSIVGFTWGEQPLLEVLLELVENSFYSHYTAMQFHGLTAQLPKTIFLNQERSKGGDQKPNQNALFDQSAIDRAFSKAPRSSQNLGMAHGQQILLLQSSYHASLGITERTFNLGGVRDLTLRLTTLERTLIDIVVRPFYAGGIHEVATAFERAMPNLSVNTMASMLKRLAYGYPYHQAIGYYLERAGYKESQVALFREMEQKRDFYLTYAMTEKSYDASWRLYVPKGF